MLNNLNRESLKVGLKMKRNKPRDVPKIEDEELEEVKEYKYF